MLADVIAQLPSAGTGRVEAAPPSCCLFPGKKLGPPSLEDHSEKKKEKKKQLDFSNRVFTNVFQKVDFYLHSFLLLAFILSSFHSSFLHFFFLPSLLSKNMRREEIQKTERDKREKTEHEKLNGKQ